MSSPDLVPPPLPWWGRAWRIGLALLASLVVLGVTVSELEAGGHRTEGRTLLLSFDIAIVTLPLYVGLWWHRRFPLWLSLAVAALSAVSTMAIGPSMLLLFSVATRRRWSQVLPMAATTVAASLAYEHVYPQTTVLPLWVGLLVYGVLTAAVVAWGMYVGARRELVAQWRWQAENAAAEQARQVAAAQQGERARIAREMHDVLAHRLSQVSLHAGVLSYRSDLTPEQVRSEAETIRAGATAALADLRGILGVLRSDTPAQVAAPQPTYADLPDLIEQARGAGQEVTLDDTPAGGAHVPSDLGRHLYRVVQEGLTNARRHAPGAPVSVRVSGAAGEGLVVRVANGPGRGTGAGGGSGLGLVGVRERVAILAGSTQAGPTPDGGWLLEASLPWRLDDRTEPAVPDAAVPVPAHCTDPTTRGER